MAGVVVRTATAADACTLSGFNRTMADETEGLSLPQDVADQGVRAVLEGRASAIYFVAETPAHGVVGQLMVTKGGPRTSGGSNQCM
mmetsp:Transcript_15086/g.44469  ORF Transcript_15086/g.44469 Transcript_15086/m.44469 type:complete len:86 (+) Transcript_15086:420-677(+)